MNIEVNKTNVKVEGNNLVIELTEELRKSLGIIKHTITNLFFIFKA